MTIIRSKVSDPNDVLDVYQEVCIAIWKGIGSFDQCGDGSPEAWTASLESWLMQITRNKCVDSSRSKEKREVPHSDEEIASLMDELGSAQFNTGGAESRSPITRIELDEAIEQLPPIYRVVVEWYYLRDWLISEIAVMEKLPEGTFKRRLHEARKKTS